MAMREAFTVGIVLAAKDMYSGVMAKAQRNLGILRKTSKESADAFERSLKRYQGIAMAGATVSVVSGQISGKIQEMTKEAINFSAAMGKMGTVIDVAGTKFKSHGEAMEAWRTKGMEVSTRSLYSASELINDVAYNLMSAGLKSDEALALMESVANTAMATIGDLNTSSQLFGSVMNTFGRRWDMSALEKGQRIMNVLSGAVKKFQWTGDILAEGLSYATAAAQSMNIPFEDTIAILGMLNTRGIEATKAGTAFLAFIRELPDAAKKMGISIADSSGKLLPLSEIMKNIERRTKGMKEIEKTILLNKAFGEEGSKLVKVLMGTSDELKQNADMLQQTGIAAAMVAERMKTLDAQTKTQKHRWQNLRIELGEKAAPTILGLKKGILELVDSLGQIPGAKAAAGITLGIVGLAAEIGKIAGPALTMVGVLGMWRTQAALAATAQAQLNAQIGAGTAASGTQAMRMGMMGSRGMALVGILGKISAVGAAAFVGWGIGTLLRQIPGLDEAVQNLFATLTGAKIGDEVDRDIKKASDILAKFKNDIEVTGEELKWFVNYERGTSRKYGESYETFKARMTRIGVPAAKIEEAKTEYEKRTARGAVGPFAFMARYQTGIKRVAETGAAIVHEGEEIRPKSMAHNGSSTIKNYYQTGIKRVAETGAAIVHEGEEIRPKSMAHNGSSTIKNYFGGVTINLKSAGSAPLDARHIARELERIWKFEARRLP